MQLETIKKKVTKSSFGAVFYIVPFISSPEFVHLRGTCLRLLLVYFLKLYLFIPSLGKKTDNTANDFKEK